MSKTLFILLLIAAAIGFYFYKSNRFQEINVSFRYTPEDVTITAGESDLHDCRLALTHDYAVDLPLLRQGQRMTVAKTDFKQWNGTILESMGALGPEIEFKLRCNEGRVEVKDSNRYLSSTPLEKDTPDGEVIESN
jgi:hypothetical protein